MSDMSAAPSTRRALVQSAGLLLGPLLALLCYAAMPDVYLDMAGQSVEFSHAARATAAVAVWMAVWWLTEALHVSVTSLLPLALLPAAQAATMKAAAAPYAHDLIYLFMGGFVLALAMERWGLHKRIALTVLGWIGTRPAHMVGGFMLVTAVLSMWVSNTATAVMMLPIAVSVVDLVTRTDVEGRDNGNFGTALMLGIAYGAAIGGVGTLIGTPPNLFLASYVQENFGQEIGFARWLVIGLPLVAVFLPLTWWMLTHVLFPSGLERIPDGEALLAQARRELGPMKRAEWATMVVFGVTALGWIVRPWLNAWEISGHKPLAGLTDAGLAVIAALVLFALPSGERSPTGASEPVMDWESARQLPWGILLLFGGGLSLASAIEANGVDRFLGAQVGGMAGLPQLAMIVLITTLVIFMTELTSNTATTATLVPIFAGIAPGLGLHPYALIIPATIAASCAFMMPVASPPNAIVFSSGRVTMAQMSRAGLWLNLIGIALVTALMYAVVLPMFVP